MDIIRDTIERIERHKIIAILRGMPPEVLLPVAEALYEGGIRLIECTFDHRRPDGLRANADMIAALVRHMGTDMAVGAGTVLTREEVAATVDAGGRLVVSPNADEAVIKEACARGAVSIPGALTPTEIVSAHAAGAHFVKIFPAGTLGAAYIKAVRAPLAHIPMLAVGGIEPEALEDYLKAGISGFGVGGPLVPKAAIQAGDFGAITERARAFVGRVCP